MKKLNEKKLGVKALSTKEMKTTNGGSWFRALRVLAAALAAIHDVTCDGGSHLQRQPDSISTAGAHRFGEF